jgi:hypothetical protein
MFSYNGKYEKDIVRFSGTPFEVSYTGENIVAVAICDKLQLMLSSRNDMLVEFSPGI